MPFREWLSATKKPKQEVPYEARKQRTFIEGHPELYPTKILSIKNPWWERPNKHAAIFSRDPGSIAALVPVMEHLRKKGFALAAVCDGRAEEMLRRKFSTKDAADDSLFALEKSLGEPDVILTDTSSEKGLEVNAAVQFPHTKTVLVEDYYRTAVSYLERLMAIRQTMPEVRLPDTICVMDEEAREIVVGRFPDLAGRVVITGQPAFDRFIDKDKIAKERESARRELGLRPNDKLVTFIGTSGQLEDMRAIAPYMKEVAERYEKESGGHLVFAYRRHPRDHTLHPEYQRVIDEFRLTQSSRANQLDHYGDYAMPTDAIAAASDLVMTNWSTIGLDSAFRRIPVLYLSDETIRPRPKNVLYPAPPMKKGCGAEIFDIRRIPEFMPELLDPESERVKTMKANMAGHYTTDGKAAERVAYEILKLTGR